MPGTLLGGDVPGNRELEGEVMVGAAREALR